MCVIVNKIITGLEIALTMHDLKCIDKGYNRAEAIVEGHYGIG